MVLRTQGKGRRKSFDFTLKLAMEHAAVGGLSMPSLRPPPPLHCCSTFPTNKPKFALPALPDRDAFETKAKGGKD